MNDLDEVENLTRQLNGIEEPRIEQPRARWLRDVFVRLGLRRTTSMNGANPIQFSEIESFCRLNDEHLCPWEVQVIEAMDSVLLRALNKGTEQTGAQ